MYFVGGLGVCGPSWADLESKACLGFVLLKMHGPRWAKSMYFRVFRELHLAMIQWYLCYSLSLRSRFCLLAASWLNRFSSLVMPTLRRASADSRVTAVRCTRCVRPAVANHYTKIILQTKGLAAIGGQLKMAFVPHRKRQGQRHAESMLTGKWLRASYYLRKHLSIGLWPHLLWIGRKGTGSRYLQDLRGPEHSLHQVIQYC